MKKLTLVLILAQALVACKASNPSLTPNSITYAPAIQRSAITQTADGLSVPIAPAVDILFVIDDSDSMRAHTANLAKNVKKFVDEIARIQTIDFHIAYTTVFDRQLPQTCPGKAEKNFDDAGTLGVLKGPAPTDGRRFVTRDDDFIGVLEATLGENIVKPYVEMNPATPEVCATGAEREESFYPLTEAFENPVLLNGPNKGFLRKGSQRVVILLSDAKDQAIADGLTDLDTVYRKLVNASGSTEQRSKVRVFAVAVKPKSTQDGRGNVTYGGNSCKVDPAFAISSVKIPVGKKLISKNKWSTAPVGEKENPLARLAQMTEDEGEDHLDQTISICDPDYGTELARFGTRVQADAQEDLKIPLSKMRQLPRNNGTDASPLTVTLAGQVLPRDKWSVQMINGVSNVVIPAKAIDWAKLSRGSIVEISYVPVDPNEATSKRF